MGTVRGMQPRSMVADQMPTTLRAAALRLRIRSREARAAERLTPPGCELGDRRFRYCSLKTFDDQAATRERD